MENYLRGLRQGLLFACIFCLSVTHVLKAQANELDNVRISVSFNKISLSQALEIIGQKSNWGITFDDRDVSNTRPISYQANNTSVTDILQSILKETSLQFKTYKTTIVIYHAKDQIANGKVLDNKGHPLVGVNIVEKGTHNGITTDGNGNFSLKVYNNAMLVFSYIGFVTVERVAATNMSITMQEDMGKLNELVVVGYGTQKAKDLTGAISHIDMKGKENSATTDLVQALQGITPGLNAKSGSMAGETGGLSIRGKTSLSASDVPLIIVDGVIFNGTTADLNINDIAAVDVLKDASSAAVYGSRSANGVLVITTKTGSSDKPSFSLNAYYGSQDLANTQMTKIMDAETFARRLVDYYYQQDLYSWYATGPGSADNRPVRPDVNDKDVVASYQRTDEEKNNYLAGYHINWLNEVLRDAPIQSYSLSVSGKTPRTNYYLSTSYADQQGIVVNDQFKRLTFFAKFENKITDWLKIEFDPTYTHRDYSGLETSLNDALIASPLGNKYNEAGQFPVYIASESYAYHPLGHLYVTDNEPKDNLNLVLKGRLRIPAIEGLEYEFNYNKNYIFNRHFQYFPKSVAEGAQVNGSAGKSITNQTKWLVNNIITYKHTFNKIHNIDVTLLHSDEELTSESTTASGTGFNSEKLGYNALELAEVQTSSSAGSREYTRSFLGRVNYGFKDRYLLTATVRRDGYSGFGSNKKWGNFPSVSLGWVLTEESFLKKTEWLDFLKLRLSYGTNGNQGIGAYNSQSEMSSTNTVFGANTAIGIYAASMGNDDLGWEKTKSVNVGVDFRFLNNRISGSVDVYHATTTDVLVQRGIPTISGNSSVWDNIGGIKNHGVEVSLETQNIKQKDFNWTTAFVFALNRNKITKLYNNVTKDIGNGWFVGHSINAVYGYETQGIWQEQDLFNKTIMSGYYPGQFKIKDQNGDATITADGDRKILGSTDANYRFSINNMFSYKRFSLSIFLNSIQGGNGYYMAGNTSVLVTGGTDKAYRLNRPNVRAYWRPDNPVNNAPGMYYNPKIAPTVYQDKSFVRLQDVTLSYNFNNKLINKWGFNNLRVYLSGRNLYTWTKWSGWDPDVQAPVIRSFIGGVNTSF
ncbi:MAG: SusC/RagA family TonB-linked outer membrane protein [Bacteroidetes bacterium]|uniref:TonB-dependent receptor n=1 Tax=[Flexibacter] sp. ATCC 35208 TaxID=1936242 RepID=UPI0009F98AE9|nr:TonB-dependent receptor [[Flexibacter] sp. ATCC 35208]MBP1650081.1 SusC/RagA family TonB-linked outer membrane protein [Bacteroidota bacterium]